jgi:hypothetical protein
MNMFNKVAIVSPLDDINTDTPLIAVPPDTEVSIYLHPEIKITDPETRSVPKVSFIDSFIEFNFLYCKRL